jgi:hypothetical protein
VTPNKIDAPLAPELKPPARLALVEASKIVKFSLSEKDFQW